MLRRFIQTQIHVELTIVERQQTIVIHYTYQNSKYENFNSHKSQTMDFRLAYCFYLRRRPTDAKVISTVNTGTLLSVLPPFLQELDLEIAKNISRI